MKTKTFGNKRAHDFPERQVGFPERNDVMNPNAEMERVYVDPETMNISRKNVKDFTREVTGVDVEDKK